MGGRHGAHSADAVDRRRLRNWLATTICMNAPRRGSSTVIAGSAYRANARSADGL
jgi:hypothetical protein